VFCLWLALVLEHDSCFYLKWLDGENLKEEPGECGEPRLKKGRGIQFCKDILVVGI
jgi:hypothetical protein